MSIHFDGVIIRLVRKPNILAIFWLCYIYCLVSSASCEQEQEEEEEEGRQTRDRQ